jgi:hypothetical protein
VKLFGVSSGKIERTFLHYCGLIKSQGRLPHASLMALDNSAFARTEKDLRIRLTDSQRWDLFTKLIEEMKLSVEDELIQINNQIVAEVGRKCLSELRDISDIPRFTSSIMPQTSIAMIILTNRSLHRGGKMSTLYSKLYELESIQDIESIKKWALDVGRLNKP